MINRYISSALQKTCVVIAMLLMGATTLSAQRTKISGNVKDDSGQPIIGATIIVKGTSRGIATNGQGNYQIYAQKGDVLQVSYIGYKTEEVVVQAQDVIDFKLTALINTLDDVVVVGYGTMRRSDLTGSVSSVSGSTVDGYKSASVAEALGGQIAGVQITQQDGTPGAGIDIKIRGIGSMTGDAGPLYIVDGFQVADLDYLSNSDIENIEVLKDASASAIYGSRAANGVVLVTTKSGKVGRPVVSFNTSSSYRTISNSIEVLSPYEFVKLQTELSPSKYAAVYYQQGEDANGVPYRYNSLDDYIGVAGIDWQKETFNPTWSFDNAVSVQGGNSDTKYSAAFSQYNEKGIFTNSSFDKRAIKLRVNQKINRRLTVDAAINYVNSTKQGAGTSADAGRFNMLTQILRARPTGGLNLTDEQLLNSAIDPLELESEPNLAQVNPILQAESVTNNKNNELWQANATATLQLFKSLTFRTAGSYSTNNNILDVFYHNGSKEAYRNGESTYGGTTVGCDERWSNNNYLTYTYKKAVHRLEAMIGHEIVFNSTKMLRGEARGFPTDSQGNDNLGLGSTPTIVNSSYADKTLISFFSRVNYNYDNRYLLTATIRNDGSSVFSQKHKWAWSPSASFAWKISQEKFMKNVGFIYNLKLRAGWGIVGNDRIASNLSMPLYSSAKYGVSGGLNTVFQNKHLPNEDLKWEGSVTTNVGLDVALFKSRLSFTVDLFSKETKDLLLAKNLPFPSGFEYQYRNIGKISNKGLELTLNSVNIQSLSGFIWKTDFNISFIRNKLLSLEQGQTHMFQRANYDSNITSYDYIANVGSSLGSMYGYVFDGVYQASDFSIDASTGGYILKDGITDISAHIGTKVAPGMVKYKDIDGDNIITDADRTTIGNGVPKFFGGLTNTLLYKNIDFSFFFQFSYGNDIYNATRLFMSQSDLERYNMVGEVSDRWTTTNASNKVPSAKGYVRNDIYSRFIEDGSFLRLKTMTLGYSLPKKWTTRIKISRIRLYGSAQNLLTITNYTGFDPEVSMRASNPMTPGVDWGAYPRSRVYSVGLDIQF